MLGKLSKWLRVLGYDTHYQSCYNEGALKKLAEEGRKLLSRRMQIRKLYSNALWLHSDHVLEQLLQLKETGALITDRSKWFTRCLVCNVPLTDAPVEAYVESVPDYILHQRISNLRLCPVCHRFFWPGSHREKMIHQLEEWGL